MQSTAFGTPRSSSPTFIPFSPVDGEEPILDRLNLSFPPYSPSSAQGSGTPTSGVYARDGIWDSDDSDDASEAQTVRPNSGATFGISSRRQSKSSRAARSRSNTIGSAKDERAKSWSRKSSTTSPGVQPPTPAETLPAHRVDISTRPSVDAQRIQKKASKNMLRGKGRRGELSVQVSPIPHHVCLPAYLYACRPPLTVRATLFRPSLQHPLRSSRPRPPTRRSSRHQSLHR